MQNKNNKKGFTLVEVLVVVIIIGILASIALPFYKKFILKSRAAEAINLLAMVRTRQAANFADKRAYFTDFAAMPGGKLTIGTETIKEDSDNTILTVGDYEIKLDTQNKCAVASYKEDEFSFSISYLREGLGCTGPICNSFGSVISSTEDLCVNPFNAGIDTTDETPVNPVCPNTCDSPRILNTSDCSCNCDGGLPAYCQSQGKVVNMSDCSCQCGNQNLPGPNWDINTDNCQPYCTLTAENCQQDEVFDPQLCSCTPCIPGQGCFCSGNQVNIEGQCRYCNGNYGQEVLANGLIRGHCCEGETPVYNETTHTCVGCPSGSTWNNTQKQCVCTATNKTLVNGYCVCDTANNWQSATWGVGLSNFCCNDETSHYINEDNGGCCPLGVDWFKWRTVNGASWNRKCCTAARKYADNTEITNRDYTTDNAVTNNCRVCQNRNHTVVGGVCKSCDAAYPGQNRVPVYNSIKGYSDCSCPSQTFANSEGVCQTCEQIYGAGYTYTPYGNASHCCAPGYTPDANETSGCSKCPTGSHFSATCQVCLTGNECTSVPGAYYFESACECRCDQMAANSNLEYNSSKNCCYCPARDTTIYGDSVADPSFSVDGCYKGNN